MVALNLYLSLYLKVIVNEALKSDVLSYAHDNKPVS
jgi:hypothetical protein